MDLKMYRMNLNRSLIDLRRYHNGHKQASYDHDKVSYGPKKASHGPYKVT